MMQACVEKRHDPLLWDTMSASLRDHLPGMNAADIGIALACHVKVDYRRDLALIVELICQLAARGADSKPALAHAPRSAMLSDARYRTSVSETRGRRHAARR